MQNWKVSIGRFLFRWRSFTPLPLLVALLLFFRPGDGGKAYPWIAAAGLLLALAGEALRMHAVGHSGHGTSGRESFFRADDLNTTGLYSLVRHPLYWGNLLIYAGLLLAYASPWGLAVGLLFFCTQYVFIIASEEAYLRDRHGPAYEQYCRRVPLYLPRLGAYATPAQRFAGRKVLFKENDSCFNLLGLFLIILAFREHRLLGRVRHGFVYLAAALVLILAYAGVKYLKKRAARPGPDLEAP